MKKMMVIYAMFAVVNKDLVLCLKNPDLLIKKNTICFWLLVQKERIGKKMASALYYKYTKSVSQEHIGV